MFQVNKSTSSSYFWNSLKSTWQRCANLLSKVFITSVAELDGKVFVALPYVRFSLATVRDKKQLLAIGGVVNNNGVDVISNKVFLWDEEN